MDGRNSRSPPFHLIESNEALRRVGASWANEECIALDTEFERSRTFYARPGLIQVFARNEVYLVDPIAVTDFAPLGDVLGDRELTKILHAGGEDIGLLRRLTEHEPRAVFDTQIAAAFVGHGFSMAYRSLVQTLCDVELPKDETRSDWLIRPLSPSQLSYAAGDVAFLIPMYHTLRSLLEAQDRESWAREECERALLTSKETAAADAYRLVPGAWQLDAHALGVLRALGAWREHEARRSDVPRAHLLPDATLIQIAKEPPTRVGQFAHWADTRAIALKRHPDTLLRVIEKAKSLRPDQRPPALSPPLDTREHGALIRSLKRSVKSVAEDLRIPPALLAPNRMINDLVKRVCIDRQEDLTDDLAGWRRHAIGERLLALIAAHESAALAPRPRIDPEGRQAT